MMNYFPLIIVFWAFFAPTVSHAEMPEGADDPAYQAAVEIWLADDDTGSLPELARLAGDGNVAAQILLGQIELHEVASSRWVAALSREERRAIFRAPGGKFGRSWLVIAAEKSRLARALHAARDFEQRRTIIPELYALGENRAIGPAITRLSNNGEWDTIVDLGSRGVLPKEYLGEAWSAAFYSRSTKARELLEALVASASEADPELSALLGKSIDILLQESPATTSIDLWQELYRKYVDRVAKRGFEESPDEFLVGNPVSAFCQARCEAEIERCTAAARELLHSRRTEVNFGSPVETLIPTERYVHTERAFGELLRHIAQYARFRSNPAEYIRGVESKSQCLASHVKSTLREGTATDDL